MAVILIIDDSPTELHLFQNMLEKNGFGTLVADSGEEGYAPGQESSRPDCILMDVVMPGHERIPGDPQTDPGSGHIGHPVIIITSNKIRKPTRSGACARVQLSTW